MGEHKCSMGGFWKCQGGDNCKYEYDRDCLYHQALKEGKTIDKILFRYYHINGMICDKGLDEVL